MSIVHIAFDYGVGKTQIGDSVLWVENTIIASGLCNLKSANVIIEHLFHSLKTENIYINEYTTPRGLWAGIKAYIAEYNNGERPHASPDYAIPDKVYRQAFATAKGG